MVYFNDKTEIDLNSLPRLLKTDYLKLKKYVEEENEIDFLIYIDTFEAHIKQFSIENIISQKTANQLFSVIGLE